MVKKFWPKFVLLLAKEHHRVQAVIFDVLNVHQSLVPVGQQTNDVRLSFLSTIELSPALLVTAVKLLTFWVIAFKTRSFYLCRSLDALESFADRMKIHVVDCVMFQKALRSLRAVIANQLLLICHFLIFLIKHHVRLPLAVCANEIKLVAKGIQLTWCLFRCIFKANLVSTLLCLNFRVVLPRGLKVFVALTFLISKTQAGKKLIFWDTSVELRRCILLQRGVREVKVDGLDLETNIALMFLCCEFRA